jgi:hypothetical protein
MTRTLPSKFALAWELLVVMGCILGFPPHSRAQSSQGNDAVYSMAGTTVGSPSFIDASKFPGGGQGRDPCDTIYGIFNNLFNNTYPATGAVIDARGISGATNLTCTHGTPWDPAFARPTMNAPGHFPCAPPLARFLMKPRIAIP